MGVSHNPVTTQHLVTKRSFDVAEFPEPSGREEAWRFTPKARFKPLFDDAPGDGRLTLSAELPDGVTITAVAAEEAQARAASAPVDRVAAMAAAHAPEATLVSVPADTDPAGPVVLRLHGTDADQVAWGSLLVEVGANARATVVVEHTGSATYGSHVSVVAGDGAHVDFVSVQNWADDAVHGGHLAVRVGRDAVVRGIVATLNGGAVRLVQTVDYDGPGGDAELIGAYLAESGQHIEHRILVDHAQPHCRSNVTYKGALAGNGAHAVWIGDVIIRAAAVGTDTYELNRNLLLTDGARADSVPNLEIETGDVVGAGHASATGRFDDDQLFYLQARGVPPAVARRLVVRGFFADVVRRIAAEQVRAEVLQAIDAELATLSAGEDQAVMAQYAEIFAPVSPGESAPDQS
jgi:Fe-S cluster assembly protein SufD